MLHRSIAFLVAVPILLGSAACSDSEHQISGPEVDLQLQQQLARNEQSADYLMRIRQEIDPNVSLERGNIRVQNPELLSAEALALVSEAQKHATEIVTSPSPGGSGPVFAAAPGRSG